MPRLRLGCPRDITGAGSLIRSIVGIIRTSHEISRHQEGHSMGFDNWRSCWRGFVCFVLLGFDSSGSYRGLFVTGISAMVEELEHSFVFLSSD